MADEKVKCPAPSCGRVVKGMVYCWNCDGFYDDCDVCKNGLIVCDVCNGTGEITINSDIESEG